jgi:plastocyanin
MVLGLLAGLALSAFADAAVAAAPAAQQTVTVEMRGNPNVFVPAEITIAPGTTVTWVDVSGTHTSTSDTGLWDTGRRLEVGESFSFTFNTPGVFPYHCVPHINAGMVGRITVSATAGKGAMSGSSLATP